MDGALSRPALSIYAVPGRTTRPADAIQEGRDAEAAGFDAVYVSERLDLKDAGTVCGALVATTSDIRVGTALIHQGTRHPVSIAAMAATLQNMSDGRFVLGLGRGLAALAPSLGVAPPTLAGMEHLVSVIRRLWAGERISEDGPAGAFHKLRFVDVPTHPAPPILFGTIGPKGLALAGRTFDGVILHPFLTTKAVGDSIALVRKAAEEAGRDPASVRVVTTLVSAPDLSPERTAIAARARAISYFQVQGLGEQLAGWNDWDPAVLTAIREHPTMRGKGIADTAMTRDHLVDAADAMPDEWFADGAAIGSSEACAQRARDYIAAGADEVLVHGASPAEATAMARAFREQP
ncbi:MAG TPA: TIGR03857 family LLM class F420-dependent oxidoreductase [Mycobacteriales bacterium]|nr:TIGR03857 family LLM class F420-dependent oxidoreductase [Mycobacteriales bacterium]